MNLSYSRYSLCLFFFVFSLNLKAAFSNYSSVLIGDRAAGMGGAFTSLSDDPSAVIYYNPAGISLMKGHSLSTAVSVYHKYDSKFGEGNNSASALRRINQGAFKAIPSSSGSILSFGHFAFGLSVIVPDHDFYSGQVNKTDDNNSNYFYSNQSLWVGIGFGKNISTQSSFGFSIYYTALDSQSSIEDQSKKNAGADTQQFLEDRTFNNNSLIYNIGYLYRTQKNWNFGINLRSPSLEISGKGAYYSSSIDTSTGSNSASVVSEGELSTDMKIPAKLSMGLSYNSRSSNVYSIDINYHLANSYYDFEEEKTYSRKIERKAVANIHLGYETKLNHMIKLRLGLFSNFSAHKDITELNQYEPGKVDMWGLSANLAVFTSEKASFTFGGYYSGGTGYSKQFYEGQYRKVETSKQVFSMLISSGFIF